MPKPPLDRSNNDDRRQWRKQGVAVGAAASKTQAKRCGCWVPQPGQWHGVSRDGEVFYKSSIEHQKGEPIMKARMPAGFGRPDMNALMRQAQKMQDDMKAKQAELEAAEYTGSASGEMVTVRMNGKHEILGITIKPEAVDPDDIEMLEDLVAAAVNATVKQVDETAEAEMGKLTGGLNIPGL
jgi:DNA-binding YbaB/EbfC family protein